MKNIINRRLEKILRKQHYGLTGDNKHSAVQICRWTKKSLNNKGFCYKEKFYGIKSHLCCQMSPSIVFCQNKCLHCWRSIEYTLDKDMEKFKEYIDKPEKIIDDCIKQQRILLSGFKGSHKVNLKKLKESQEPNQFAISLAGEPTLYPYLSDLILELKRRRKTSFLVTNGLNPNALLKLERKNSLPTQLYISLNAPNEKLFQKISRNKNKNAWKKFNQSLNILKNLKKTRKVLRLTLIRDLNMSNNLIGEYAKLIRKASPNFIEVKGFMSVGFSRKRLGYERMPSHAEIKSFSEKLASLLKLKILDEQIYSRVVLLGKSKKNMKIKGI